ncbi:MAG: hypothetical protein V3S56_06690, partial [Gemmatimonadota bacterium]
MARLISRRSLVIATMASLMAGSLSAQVVGDWTGSLNAGGTELFLVLHITEQDSTLAATMDSPDQGAYGIAASSAVIDNDTLTVEFAAIGGKFVAGFSETGTLDGTWTQSGQAFPLELTRSESTGESPEARRPQDPTEPFPYLAED